jgi:hypothetical protein
MDLRVAIQRRTNFAQRVHGCWNGCAGNDQRRELFTLRSPS